MDYSKIRNNPKQFKAVTSFSVEEFDDLLALFSPVWNHYIERFNLDGSVRRRKYSPRAQDQLPTTQEKLFFILYYLKQNPIQEALAASFDLTQDMCNKWIHVLTPLLQKSLKQYQIERNANKVEHLLADEQTYIADATERTIQRDLYDQEHFYSGKKNSYAKESHHHHLKRIYSFSFTYRRRKNA